MVQPVVTRSQRRIERKQLAVIVALILAVASVSFLLGVMYGKAGGSVPGFNAGTEKLKLPVVTQIAPPPTPVAIVEKPETLTFYENLPKGNQAPLGSGINLPPEQKKSVAEAETKKIVLSSSLPAESLSGSATLSIASGDGPFVVQIASFRTGEDAGKLASRLKKYQLTTFVESADLGEKGVWYRVLAGPYVNREKADQTVGLLREKERFSALVRQR